MMTKKTMWRGAFGVLSGALVVGALAASPARAEVATYAVTTSASTVGIGDQVTVTVAADGAQDLYAYRFALAFDPTLFAYVADSATTDVTGPTYATAADGDLTVLHTKLGSSPAASGDVTLVTATFTALKAGTAEFDAPKIEVVGTDNDTTSVDEVAAASVTVDRTAAPTATVAPKISGKGQVGQLLSLSTGTWSTPGVATKVQWLRAGKPIPGATRTTYRTTTADYRSAISAKVTVTKADHADGTATAKAVTVSAKATSRTAVKAPASVKARKTWKAKVTVSAAGLTPKGWVSVHQGGKILRKKVTLVNGRATVSLKVTAKGKRQVRFVYHPETGVAASTKVVKVRVR